MNDRPCGEDLLKTARRTLLDKILPALPADKVYDALMIANAMAITSRELAGRPSGSNRLTEALDTFYREAGLNRTNDTADIMRDLALKVRQDQIPSGQQFALRELFLDITRQRLAVSNPRHLEQ